MDESGKDLNVTAKRGSEYLLAPQFLLGERPKIQVLHLRRAILDRIERDYPQFRQHKLIYLLPQGTKFGRVITGNSFYALVKNMQEDRTLAFSQVPLHKSETGQLIEAVLISELPIKPIDKFEELKPFYRWTRVKHLPLILRYGFYTLPGRKCLYSQIGTEDIFPSDSVVVAMNLEHSEVIAENPTSKWVGLNFPEKGFESLIIPD